MLCLVFLAPATQAQRPVTGRLVDSVTADAVVGGRIRAAGAALETVSDREGRFVVALARPDTLIISALGYLPFRVAVVPGDAIVARLVRAAVVGDLTVTAARPGGLLGESGHFNIDDSTARILPVTLEPDAFRVLGAVPGVTFGSILSARPQLLGGSDDDTGFAIDGHTVRNPFHAGRYYSAFPSIAASTVDVQLAPGDLGLGGTVAGRVNVNGKRWNCDRPSEIQYGLGLWSAMTGWANDRTAITVAARTLQGTAAGAAAALADDEVEVSVGDAYVRADLDEFRTTVTLFHASDHAGEVDDGFDSDPTFLTLRNTLVGLRTTLAASSHRSVSLMASHASHRSDGGWMPARGTNVDTRTWLRERTVELRWNEALGRGGATAEMIAGVGNRLIDSRVTPEDPLELPLGITELRRTATLLGIGVDVPAGEVTLRAGVRADRYNGRTAVQPRISARLALGSDGWLEARFGRAATLLHLVSDVTTDPKLAFYDYWLAAGQPGVPVGSATHGTLELGQTRSGIGYRLRAYRSTGEGSIALDVDHTPRDQPTGFRVGRTRAMGVEAAIQVRAIDDRWQVNASYLLSSTERNWGSGWIAARDDRRHRLRMNGYVDFGFHTVLAVTLDAGSALPFTTWLTDYPGPRTWGPENGSRGKAGIRVDAALTHEFDGPLGTRMTFGASINNLSLGDQVLREPTLEWTADSDGSARAIITSEPLFWLPPVPSVLLRVRW